MPSVKSAAQSAKDGFMHHVLGAEKEPDRVTRGESVVSTASSTEAYVEADPSAWGYVREVFPGPQELSLYFRRLVPLFVLTLPF